ncbi:MAG: T9SS type A sorting domain-containing protein, partial [Bacteroidia bacterium]
AAERVTIEYLDAKEVPVSKIEYGYDINHYLITDTYYEWNEVTKVYDVIDKIEYTYDAKGNKLTDSYSEWNAGTKKWDVLDKYTNLYDAKDNQIRSLYQEWQVNKFVNSSKDSFTYDLSNNMHINVYAEWDALKSKWTPVEKIENTYDSKRNQTLSMRYVWEARGAGKWVNSYKSESSFDTAYDVSQLILPYDKETIDLHFKTKHLKTWEYSWNKATSVWDSAATTIYNYILQGSTGVRHIQNNSGIEVYPNPADDKVYIKTPNHYGGMEVKIYALAGKLVQSNDMGNLEFINISDLKNGIYFLQISAGQNLLSIKKLIVN